VALATRLEALFARAEDERSPAERTRLVRLMTLLAELPPPPDPGGDFPAYTPLREAFVDRAHTADDPDEVEEAFLELYCHLHMHEAPYTAAERGAVDRTGGYWNHAGGLAPLLGAGPHVTADTTSMDLGAGNGLQLLLLQHLDPHRRTIQVEISSRSAAIGRRLQRWLGIPAQRVRWEVADVMDFPVAGVDFLYLYRPVKPVGDGVRLYERLAAELEAAPRPVVVFSIADCLRTYLSDRFELLYHDGHLTCLRGPLPSSARPR